MNRSKLLFSVFLLFISAWSFAQDSVKVLAPDSMKTWVDTTNFTLFDNKDEKYSSTDYIHSIEKAYETLNRIQNEGQLNYNLQSVKTRVTDNDSALKLLRQGTRGRSNTTIRNLQLYRELLTELQANIAEDRIKLDTANNKLEKLEADLRTLTHNQMLAEIMADSALRNQNKSRLRRLQFKWRRADSLIETNLDTLNAIRTEAADNAIAVSEMLNRINTRLRRSSIQAMGKEYNYLWEPASKNVTAESSKDREKTKMNERKLLNYYVQQKSGKMLLFAVCLGIFWLWTSRTFRMLRHNKDEEFIRMHLPYLRLGRFPAAVIAVFCFVPFFDIYAPSSFIEIIQLIILITVAFMLRKQLSQRLFYYWLAMVALFASYFVLSGAAPTFFMRSLFIVLNLGSALLAYVFFRRVKEELPLAWLIKTVAVIHIVLNLLAVLCNLYGRITIAQTFRVSGIYGLTQIVALIVCLQIFKEAVLAQIQSSRIKRGVLRPFDTTEVSKSLQRPLLIVICILWLIMFTVNMNVYGPLRSLVLSKLAAPLRIGSAAFTPGSVVLFFAIIWIAHLLQRYTGYIFGDIGFDDNDDEDKEQRSKMLISKLVILTLGYFLAVAASGLPIDKITIVLGALGVGIGLGLQNIVSNFISGIILIFDRPLQIGDTIEVGNKSGKVKEIGMRSSTLLTAEGAEVIIPNGDILSQQITNWTLSNNYKRLELSFTLLTNKEKEALITTIGDMIKTSEFVYKEREPVVLVESIKEEELGLKVFFWCNDIYKADQVKSEIRFMLYRQLKEQGIAMK